MEWDFDSFLQTFVPGFTANEKDYGSEYYDKALKDIDDLYNGLDLTRKTAKQHYEAGRETAGMEAADKAGQAKKAAKAAAMMNNAGKMTAAVQGAQAAADAATNGYDEAANTAAAMSQSQENAEKADMMNRAGNKASAIYQAAAGKAQAKADAQKAKEARRNQVLNTSGLITSALLGFKNK